MFPEFITSVKAGRITVPTARLQFSGLASNAHPRAELIVDSDAGAVCNGIPFHGRASLEFSRHFVGWIDREQDKAEHRVGWHVADFHFSRVGSFLNSLPSGAREIIRGWAEHVATEFGTVEVMRQARGAELVQQSHDATARADTHREMAEAESAVAKELADRAGVEAGAPQLFAVMKHGSQLLHTWPTLNEALRECESVAADRASRSRWGLSSHDFPQILNVYDGEWIQHPRAVELDAVENAERAGNA